MRTAVVGHVEWVEFASVAHVPRPGEIVHARSTFAEPAGGGGVASVQLARLAGDCTLLTALGDDELGTQAIRRLTSLGVRVEAACRAGRSTRRAFTLVDDGGERTITTLGERLQPSAADELPWQGLDSADAVYFVAGDVEALRLARHADALVATSRVMDILEAADVELDAVVGSASDESERYRPLKRAPRYVVMTAGARGGSWLAADGTSGEWAAVAPTEALRDAYGAGDSFAAGLAFALGRGDSIDDALTLAARCGAISMTGRGPYERQLSAGEL